MNEVMKKNVLEAWIMTEQLSEGSFPKGLGEIRKGVTDYRDFLEKKIDEKNYDQKANPGVELYFGNFEYKELREILLKTYNITAEESDDIFDKKFTFKIALDKDFNLIEDSVFLTFGGVVKVEHDFLKKSIKEKGLLAKKEKELKEKLKEKFNYKDLSPEAKNEKINASIRELIEEYCFGNDYETKQETLRYRVVGNVKKDNDYMHSFYVKDLQQAMDISNSENLNRYLDPEKNERINLDSEKDSENFNPKAFEDVLKPIKFPYGRFPEKSEYGLSFMQQVAVNIAVSENENIRSVNGPPGTGKTTLLRDVFADHVVQQAYEICKLSSKKISGKYPYFKDAKIGRLPAEIAEKNIIIASSNNGAVQNITQELPLLEKIGDEFRNQILEADYFTKTANKVIKKKDEENIDEIEENEEEEVVEVKETEIGENWGMFSMQGGSTSKMGPLLDKVENMVKELKDFSPSGDVYKEFKAKYDELEKIKKYVEFLFYKDEDEKRLKKEKIEIEESMIETREKLGMYAQKLTILESRKPGFLARLLNSQEAKQYEKERLEILKKQEKEINNLEKLIVATNENTNKLEEIEKSEEEVKVEIPGKVEKVNYALDYADLQKISPVFSKEFRVKQSELFILALKVRKQFLKENEKNLNAAHKIRKIPDGKSSELKEIAWEWINFAIPVIGSTFASIGLMFRGFGPNSLGSLFIDEAGQAIPQAAIGAIFRSKKVMAVGDPAQIPPVLTLNPDVLRIIREGYNVDEYFLSADASVQTLMDNVGKYGYYKDEENWIGIPLWVHRRCADPMFSIANRIAYNDKMVTATKTDESCKSDWYDVGGESKEKYVSKQGEFLREKIKEILESKEVGEEQIYVITPFVKIKKELQNFIKEIDEKNIGTVHTFQGKEAKVVFFVLGCGKGETGAARWAVNEPNILNVAATRAKKCFYVIGDKKFYKEEVKTKAILATMDLIDKYNS